MSWQALAWATKCRVGDEREKLILLMLANYANEEGESWYSQDRLSFDTETPVRTLRRRLQILVDKGFIEVIPRRAADGTKATSLIKLIASAPSAKFEDSQPAAIEASGQNELAIGQNGGVAIGQQVAGQESSVNHKKEPSPRRRKAIAYTEEFERDVWGPYQRKDGTSKANAFKKYQALPPEDQDRVKATIPIYWRMAERSKFDHHLEFFISRRIFETVPLAGTTPTVLQAPAPAIDRPTWETFARLYETNSRWNPAWGPEPGHPRCQMPADLQRKFVNGGLTQH